MQRRYRHLFRLPTRNRTIVYSSTVILLTTAISRIGLGYSLAQTGLFFLLTEALLLLSIGIDKWILEQRNKLATYRRLSYISIISNGFWLITSILGYAILFFKHDSVDLVSLVILGAMFAIAFRALILGSLFYDRFWRAIPLSFVQPVLLFVSVGLQFRPFSSAYFFQTIGPVIAIVSGAIVIGAVELYVLSINRMGIGSHKPLELLQAFLNGWAAEKPNDLEEILENTARERSIESQILVVSSQNREAKIILPGVHPGPFYPIGSSNISGDIFAALKSSESFPMVAHSMSDHGLNLSSKLQVERYIGTIKERAQELDYGSTMTSPVVRQAGKATATGMALGSTLLVAITQAPFGMEDFPSELRMEIENYSRSKQFKNILVLDAHNSEGEKPKEKECLDALSATKEVIDQLSVARQQDFKVGVAHSSELNVSVEPDIGPAGIGLVLFEIGQETMSLVIADANNALIGFREKVLADFEHETHSKVLEICTSDTHITAAKTSDAKGYLTLGDKMSHQKFASILTDLHHRALDVLSTGRFSSSVATARLKTIGSNVLDDFADLLDSASSGAKRGAVTLGAIAILVTVIVALV